MLRPRTGALRLVKLAPMGEAVRHWGRLSAEARERIQQVKLAVRSGKMNFWAGA